jgi:hypothetical protein
MKKKEIFKLITFLIHEIDSGFLFTRPHVVFENRVDEDIA